MRRLFRMTVMLFAIVLIGIAYPANASELLTNGDFESGIIGWDTYSISSEQETSGGWYIYDDETLPLGMFQTVGPAGGNYYAVSDMDGPGTYLLWQEFTVPGPVSSVILTYDMFVNDWNGGPSETQHARVDIITAALFDLDDLESGVLAPLYWGVDEPNSDATGEPQPYTAYIHDITPMVGMGGDYIIRYTSVVYDFYLNQGVDNVSIDYAAGVPEPATMLLLGSGLIGLAAFRRKFRKK